MRIGEAEVESRTTPNGQRLRLLACTCPERDERDNALQLDAREVEELRDALDEFLAGRRV